MNSRGLTLVEVLASAALLAVMTGACIPLMRDAARLSALSSESVVEDTARLRNALASLSDEEQAILSEGTLALEELDGEPVYLVLVSSSDNGEWLRWSWKNASVLLWQPMPESTEVQP